MEMMVVVGIIAILALMMVPAYIDRVGKGIRIVHGDKELTEKRGRNDPCPCGSSRSFQEVLPPLRAT